MSDLSKPDWNGLLAKLATKGPLRTDWKADFRAYLIRRSGSPIVGIEKLQTHMMEIWRMMREGLEGFCLPDENDTLTLTNGLCSEFTFADGKRYRVTIKEIRK